MLIKYIFEDISQIIFKEDYPVLTGPSRQKKPTMGATSGRNYIYGQNHLLAT